MEIKKVITGVLDENCYVLIKNNTAIIIDPGDDYLDIKEAIGENKVLAVLITHSHFDHIGALRNFLTKRSIKIFKKSSLEEKEYTIGDFKFKCIYTPGHSKDSVSFFFEENNCMFVGDFIFKESIGRTDLPGGDNNDMKESLNKLLAFNESITLYPGHDDETTLKYEKEHNPYLK
ncbi:metallo-beta-lactamase family protein [Mycoplasma sp. CAG:877]|nr:metallo-beta-lactamase family protein [Mycoplasma sp. CAG:877]